MLNRRLLMRFVVAPGLALVVADVALSLFVIRDGAFQGRPLPPFGSFTHPRQHEWAKTLHQAAPTKSADGIGRFDAELGWSWRPSSASPDGRFHINSIGARGEREYAPTPPSGVTRVACFGDSFVFCDEMADGQSFQAILERTHPRFEVPNFGVSGFGTDQALLRYRRLGRGLGSEVIVIGILVENIGRNVNRYRPLWNPSSGFCAAKPRFVLRQDELELLPQPFSGRAELWDALQQDAVLERIAEGEAWLGPRVPTGKLSSLGRLAAGFFAYRARRVEPLWRDTDGEAFRVTVALLERFQHEALADGARLAPVLIFPTPEDLGKYVATGEMYWSALHAELDRRGVPWIDVTEALAKHRRAREAGTAKGTMYFGGHLSGFGNSVVANELFLWLRAH